MENQRICFIGCGNMGTSLIGGLIANGYTRDLITGVDPDPRQRDKLKDLFGIPVHANNSDALDGAEIVLLAVKPQVMQQTLAGIAEFLTPDPVLIISIAAGIRASSITGWLAFDHAVVRAMPNTPALIRAGVTALFANAKTSESQKELAESIMRSVGTVLWLDQESSMDAVTALSGSGPAYFFMLMEVLEKAADKLDLNSDQSRLLVMETALGAAKMAVESGYDAATLRRQVTSPGGTTEAALNILIQENIEELFLRAVTAARDRSREIADTLGGKNNG